ncbi:MAG: Spx/MgsR family RNA polymerase-binding regulatory protein [Pseudomonadota bacterium]
MSTVTLYGLRQCDTCRRAMRWLDANAVAYHWVDIREKTPATHVLSTWIDAVGISTLVNRRSTTWRTLDAATRDLLDDTTAPELLRQHPTLIKRPVLAVDKAVSVGFDEADWRARLPGLADT